MMSTSTRRYLILFLLGWAATIPFWGCYHDMDDEAAVAVLGATRLLRGEIPYRDWTTRHTPGTYFVTALYFLFFGSGQLSTRSLMGLVSSCTGLMMFKCSERVAQGSVRYLPWLLWTCSGICEKPNLNHHWLGALSTVVTIYWAQRWALDGGRRDALWLGCSAAVSSWFLQSNGLSSLLLVMLVGIRCRPPGLLRVGAAYLVTQVALWLPWLPWVRQVWTNHFSILAKHVQFNRQAYSWHHLGEYADSFRGIDLTHQTVHGLAAWTEFARLVLQYGGYYIVIVGALLVAERRRERSGLVLAYSCLAWALTTGYNQNPDYLSYAVPAFQLSALVLLSRPWRWRNVLVYAWSGMEVLSWVFRSGSIGLAFVYPVQTRAGTYWTVDPQESAAMNQMHTFVEEHCPPGTAVLAYPYFTREYTLEYLKDPIQQPILVPWLYEDYEFDDCLKALDQQKVPFILHRVIGVEAIRSDFPKAPVEELQAEFTRQQPRVFAHYQLVWSYPGYEIWARKERQP